MESVSYWTTNLSTPQNRKVVKKKKRVTLIWGCTAHCRQLSDSEIKSIVALKNLFSEDMAVLREGLDNIDTCPYEHSHKQEWEIPFNHQKADLPECEYTLQQKKGHPLVCHIIERYDKVRDYALHVCICCERLFRRKQCTKVGFDDFQDKLVRLGIKAFSLLSNPDLDEKQRVFLCILPLILGLQWL